MNKITSNTWNYSIACKQIINIYIDILDSNTLNHLTVSKRMINIK